MVTGSASGGIVGGTLGAGIGRGAHNTWDCSLAGGLVHRTCAALSRLGERSQDSMLIAVEQRLNCTQPKANRPVEKEKEDTSVKVCVKSLAVLSVDNYPFSHVPLFRSTPPYICKLNVQI